MIAYPELRKSLPEEGRLVESRTSVQDCRSLGDASHSLRGRTISPDGKQSRTVFVAFAPFATLRAGLSESPRSSESRSLGVPHELAVSPL